MSIAHKDYSFDIKQNNNSKNPNPSIRGNLNNYSVQPFFSNEEQNKVIKYNPMSALENSFSPIHSLASLTNDIHQPA